MSNEQKPSAEAVQLVRLIVGYRPMNERDWTITIQECEWVALNERLAGMVDRVRREARAEAFEEAEASMYSDDVVFVTHHGQAAWQSCLLKLRALAAKERAS